MIVAFTFSADCECGMGLGSVVEIGRSVVPQKLNPNKGESDAQVWARVDAQHKKHFKDHCRERPNEKHKVKNVKRVKKYKK